MQNGVIFLATIALMIGGTAACSGPAPANPEPGTLPPGTAQLTINGKNVGTTTGAVQCAPVESLTTITVGDDAAGATVMVSNAEKLTVEFVRIRNLSGFTGNYNRGLEGNATVAMTDATYDIKGAALGYSPKSVERTTEPFAIRVSC